MRRVSFTRSVGWWKCGWAWEQNKSERDAGCFEFDVTKFDAWGRVNPKPHVRRFLTDSLFGNLQCFTERYCSQGLSVRRSISWLLLDSPA